MEDATSEKLTMRFLSFAGDEDAEKDAKLKEAAAKIEQAMAKEKVLSELVDYKEEHQSEIKLDPANDTRSLYDRLQEQKNKKQEDFEESQKLSNYISKLDDDDIEYLNEVAKKKQEDEIRRKLEIQDALDAKKRLDEQKMLEEEKRMKESFLGHNSQSSKTKSRIFSLIKMKPKVKKEDSSGTKPDTRIACDAQNLHSPMPTEKPIADTSTKHTSDAKTPSTDRDQSTNTKRIKCDDKIEDTASKAIGCTCPKDVMVSMGVLPSLPIIKDLQDSSEKESDNSDDDLYGRLVPRTRKRRR